MRRSSPKIEITPGVLNNIITPYYTETDFARDNAYFTTFMLYVIFPMLYIIFTTGSLQTILLMFAYIQKGVFDAVHGVKQFLTNTMIYALRVFGYYTFSTYIVVKDGRELFSATSEYFFMKSTRENIKRTDQAKYRICKWIDNECRLYRQLHNDEEAELTETRNDIYDFIIHHCDDGKRTRIHRGDFRISTHTSFYDNYRIFCKTYQLSNTVELRISINNESTEVVLIDMKTPFQFYVEKNIILDRAFLRWYLYNKLGRKDLADFIGLPGSTYTVHVYYEDFMKENRELESTQRLLDLLSEKATDASAEAGAEATADAAADAAAERERFRAVTLRDGQYIMVGSVYTIKVDPILHCPIFESSNQDVFHIDDILSKYYENSVCSNTDGEDSEDGEDDEYNEDSDDGEDNEDSDDNEDSEDDETVTEATDPEFEIIENSS